MVTPQQSGCNLRVGGVSAQVKVFVTGLFSLNQDIPAFKEHLRDFLVQIKVSPQRRGRAELPVGVCVCVPPPAEPVLPAGVCGRGHQRPVPGGEGGVSAPGPGGEAQAADVCARDPQPPRAPGGDV